VSERDLNSVSGAVSPIFRAGSNALSIRSAIETPFLGSTNGDLLLPRRIQGSLCMPQILGLGAYNCSSFAYGALVGAPKVFG